MLVRNGKKGQPFQNIQFCEKNFLLFWGKSSRRVRFFFLSFGCRFKKRPVRCCWLLYYVMTFPRFFYSIGNKKLFLDHFTQSQQALKNSSQHRRMSRFSQKWLEHTKDNKQILLVNYCPRAPKSSLNLPLNHDETSFMF